MSFLDKDNNSGISFGSNANVQGHVIQAGDSATVIINTTQQDYSEKLIALYEENKKLLEEKNLSDKEKYELLKRQSDLETKLTNIDQSYKDYIASLQKRISDLENNPNLSENIKTQAIEALGNGDNKEADRLFAKIDDESRIIEVAIEVAEARYQRCLIAQSEIRYYDALDFIEKALDLIPDNALYLNDAGFLTHTLGQYDKAIEYHNKSLNIKLETLGESHPDVATSYNNLGATYRTKREYNKAIEYYDKSLNIWRKTLGEDHPLFATSYNNLGSVYHKEKKYNKAIEYYNQSLAILLKTLGDDHPAIATSYNNLGLTYYAKGEYNKAISYHNKSLAIRLKILGINHPDVAQSYNSLGSIYFTKQDYAKVEDYLNKALVIYLKTLGENHPDTKNIKKGLQMVAQAKNGK